MPIKKEIGKSPLNYNNYLRKREATKKFSLQDRSSCRNL